MINTTLKLEVRGGGGGGGAGIFWLSFLLNKECAKLLCGLGIDHRIRKTIPLLNSFGEKRRILLGITVYIVSKLLQYWPPCDDI